MKKENNNYITNFLPDKIISFGLIFIYLSLTLFGIISISKPNWLVDLSRANRKLEAGIKVNEGIVLSRQNKDLDAIAKYDEALDLMPDFVEAIVNKGVSYKRLKMYGVALSEFRKALKMSPPDSSNIYSNIKDIFLEKKDSLKADFYFKKSISTNHSTIDKYMKKGIHFYNLRKMDSSLSAYNKALSHRLNMETYYNDVLLKEGKNNISLGDPLVKKEMNSMDKNGFFKKFDSVCFKLNLIMDKGLAENYNKIGCIIALKGDYKLALSYFYNAVNIWKDYPDANSNIRYIYENINKK